MADTPSHFFKIMLPTALEEKKMSIPEKFVRIYGKDLLDIVNVTGPTGQVWHVKLFKEGKQIWFRDGWDEFVRFHSIVYGHLLVFKYEKYSEFRVLIFDKSACEVVYSGDSEKSDNDEKSTNDMEIPDKDSSASVQDSSSAEDSEEEQGPEKDQCCPCGGGVSKPKNSVTEAQARAVEAAESFDSNNPYCWVILKKSYMQKGMHLPLDFSSDYLKGVSGLIQLQLSGGQRLPVRCIYDEFRRGARLGRGWTKFIRRYKLKEGDVCVFELIRSNVITINVIVFRVASFASSGASASKKHN